MPHGTIGPGGNSPSKAEIDDIAAAGEKRRQRDAETAARRDLLRHPVTEALKDASGGAVPNGAELDALSLSTDDRRRVESGVSELTALREKGENQQAHNKYLELAAEIVGSLPEEQRPSDYLEVEEVDDRGPAELAAGVRAW